MIQATKTGPQLAVMVDLPPSPLSDSIQRGCSPNTGKLTLFHFVREYTVLLPHSHLWRMPEKSNLEFKKLSCTATQIPLRGMPHLSCVQRFGFKEGNWFWQFTKGNWRDTSLIISLIINKKLTFSHCCLQTPLFRASVLIPGNNLGRSDPIAFLLFAVLMKCHLQA